MTMAWACGRTSTRRPGVGLQNVKERLTMYSQAARMAIGNRPGERGTSVTILVPLHAH